LIEIEVKRLVDWRSGAVGDFLRPCAGLPSKAGPLPGLRPPARKQLSRIGEFGLPPLLAFILLVAAASRNFKPDIKGYPDEILAPFSHLFQLFC
jgi:hypothetical protein